MILSLDQFVQPIRRQDIVNFEPRRSTSFLQMEIQGGDFESLLLHHAAARIVPSRGSVEHSRLCAKIF